MAACISKLRMNVVMLFVVGMVSDTCYQSLRVMLTIIGLK